MTQQAQAEALQVATLLDESRAAFGDCGDRSKARAAAELRRLHARVQELTEKAAKYDHLLPYLCKTCGGFGLVDRRCHDDPLGSEPCPDCAAQTPPAQERKPLTDEQIESLLVNWPKDGIAFFDFARAIERAHGIGEETK